MEQPLQAQADSLVLHFSVEVTNRTDMHHLLYGFKDLLVPLWEVDCSEEKFTAGTNVFILDEKGQPQEGKILISLGDPCGGPVDSTEIADRMSNYSLEKPNADSSRVLLTAGSKKVIYVSFEAMYDSPNSDTYYELEPGKYQLYLLYRSGNYLPNIVPREKIEADMHKYKAQVFQGCVKSNIVSLILN